jgi:hypothetical protein
MFSTGTQTDQGQFSRDMVGTIVREYLYIAGQLSTRRWNLITALCGESKEPSIIARHSVQMNRRALYEPSSPMQEVDDE